MKNKGWIGLALLALGLGSCATEELDKLKAEKQQLHERMATEKESVAMLVQGMEAVQEDIRSITMREGLLEGLTVSDAELAASPQEQVLGDIALIDGLIKKNQVRIDELHQVIKASDGKLFEFERVIANLKLDLLDREVEMTQVKDNLIAMEESYADLLEDMQVQTMINTMQDEALHKAYFAYGTKEELIQGEVMEKKGAVLGLGGAMTLKADFNKGYFTEVDMRQLERIPLESQRVDLLSAHPEGSYELIEEGRTVRELRITDPDQFWSGSRYLAMVVK